MKLGSEIVAIGLKNMKIETEILAILKLGKRPLHWFEIRNELIYDKKENVHALTVKLSRALKHLERDGLVKRNEIGHKNIIYSLPENFNDDFLNKKPSPPLRAILDVVMVGTWEPGISFEKLKKRALDQWIEYFERNVAPELEGFWSDMKQ